MNLKNIMLSYSSQIEKEYILSDSTYNAVQK